MTTEARTATQVTHNGRMIAFYVFAFAAGGVIRPFLNLYLAEVGLTGAEIGVLQGWTALVTVIITPLIGAFADRTQRHRLLLAVIVFLKGISAPLLLVSNAWAWLAGTVSLRMFTAQAQDALMNRLTLASLQARKRTNLGGIRFWGALSFAATSLLAGWLARDASISVLFPLAGVMGTLSVLFVGAFPARIAERGPSTMPRPTLPGRQPALWVMFGVIFVFYLSRSGTETFVFVHIGDNLGARNDLIGFLGALSGLAPLPAFYLADVLVRHYGPVATMATGFGFFGAGWLGLSLIALPLLAAPLIILQGFGEALYLVSMVWVLGTLGRPERAATDQMLAQLTVPGLAAILAQPASGWIFDMLSGNALFALDAGIVFVLAIVILRYRKRLVPKGSS